MSVRGKLRQLGIYTDVNGKPSSGFSSADEFQGGGWHRTDLLISGAMPAIAGGADLAVGKLIYTFPSGVVFVWGVYMSIGLTQTQGFVNSDTPDMGIGTVIASGVVSVLSGTATFEDIITGQTVDNCTGTKEVTALTPTQAANAPFIILTGAAHTLHLNIADGWAASGDTALAVAGNIVIQWSHFTST